MYHLMFASGFKVFVVSSLVSDLVFQPVFCNLISLSS